MIKLIQTVLLIGAVFVMFIITGCRKEPRPRPDAGIGGYCQSGSAVIAGVGQADCEGRGYPYHWVSGEMK
ncbi:MAG: hypothetical protein HY886_09900 [Deltaproteobacteria bacterium]|nr:hypothetical protein [Deltaproteobacteria bacterium]